jgi:hypothetical protein
MIWTESNTEESLIIKSKHNIHFKKFIFISILWDWGVFEFIM